MSTTINSKVSKALQNPELKTEISDTSDQNSAIATDMVQEMDNLSELVEQVQIEEAPPFSTFTCFSNLPTEIRLRIWSYSLPSPRLVPLTRRLLKPNLFIQSGTVSSKWPIKNSKLFLWTKRQGDGKVKKFLKIKHLPLEIKIPLDISTLNTAEQGEIDIPTRINLSNLSGFTSTAEPPSLLFVNHEAHSVASHQYTRAFGAHCALPTTWFDYTNDTLHFVMNDDTYYSLIYQRRNNFLEETITRISAEERALVKNIVMDLSKCRNSDKHCNMWIGWTIVLFPNVRSVVYEVYNTRETIEHAMEEDLNPDSIWPSLAQRMEERKEKFANAFRVFRRYGTVDYKGAIEWDDYVANLHGDKDLVVEEVRLNEWLEERGMERPYEGEMKEMRSCCFRRKERKIGIFLTWVSRGRLVSNGRW